ncbi:MAG: hypothetical protein AUK31_00485 [Fibrobacteres bacterium CG2_30_45_31]|nr:MAG: hypothetical protein AUK31_00485 [Fibrobacteres bacterium CG2_30_45_31]
MLNFIATQIKNARHYPYTWYVLFAFALFVFNCFIWWQPSILQSFRENRAENRFADFWEKEGAQKFQSVGITPSEQIYQEELVDYLKKYHEKNPPLVPEQRIAQMKTEFREWWETGGKADYILKQGLAPSEELYQQELSKWIKGYTDKLLEYNLFLIPNEGNIQALLTYWLLFPGFFSLLIFIGGFLFTMYFLEKRWGALPAFGIFLGSVILGGVIFSVTLPFSYFDRYADMPFMGGSLSLALLLGAASMERVRFTVPKPIIVTCGIFLFLDMLVNWTVNPNLFGFVTLLTPVFFGSGIILGRKMPPRKKSQKELAQDKLNAVLQKKSGDPIAERKARARAEIDAGLSAANQAEYIIASRLLISGFSALLQEFPLDVEYLKSTASKMVNPNLFLEISSVQWLEWGCTATEKNVPEAAINLLEKALTIEKEESLVRKSLYRIGELRIRYHLKPQEGIKRLEKVIELGDHDILAAQAKKLLEQQTHQ